MILNESLGVKHWQSMGRTNYKTKTMGRLPIISSPKDSIQIYLLYKYKAFYGKYKNENLNYSTMCNFYLFFFK